MGKRKQVFIFALVVALCALALFVHFQTKRRFSTFQRLPDGSYLRLAKVQFSEGTQNYQLKAVTGWKAVVAKYLPTAWRLRLGWYTSGASMVFSGGPGTNLCICAVRECSITNKGFNNVRLIIFDESGNSFDGGEDGGSMYTVGGKQQLTVEFKRPPIFPRRGRVLGLRYLQKSKEGWERVAEFTAENPAYGKYPSWTPEPLPSTKVDGDLSVTLLAFKTGLSEKDPQKPAADNEPAVTEAAFRIVQSGHETNAWRPKTVEISDATGNDWTPYPALVSSRHEDDVDFLSFGGALWPGEAAWKMRVEFSRIADFAPDEIFGFTNVIVPGATQVIKLDDAVKVGGKEVRLIAISGNKAQQPEPYKWGGVNGQVNLSIQFGPLPGYRLTLLKVTDDAGREVHFQNPTYPGEKWHVYGVKAAKEAKRLDFTFALHKSRFVEFQVKPEFVRAD